jgi:hypothetical protein
VVAAAVMIDAVPIEVTTDARGSLKDVVDWSALYRRLRARAAATWDNALVRSVANSVIDDRDAHQVANYLWPAVEAMNYARSYYAFAEQTGASTISWFGSPFDLTIAPAATGVAMTWAAPAGVPPAQRTNEGHATFSPDGVAAPLMMTRTRNGVGGLVQDIIAIDPLPA